MSVLHSYFLPPQVYIMYADEGGVQALSCCLFFYLQCFYWLYLEIKQKQEKKLLSDFCGEPLSLKMKHQLSCKYFPFLHLRYSAGHFDIVKAPEYL